MSAKKPHATVGPNPKPGSLERAADIAKQVIEFGVAKSDTVIDYGCSTLRIGQFLIEYLDPRKFIGLDIDQRIVDQGLAILPPALVAEKQPTVDVINDDSIARWVARHPRWICNANMIHHVPPEELNEFFGTSLIWTRSGEDSFQSSAKSWVHGNEELLNLSKSSGFSAELVQDRRALKPTRILVLRA